MALATITGIATRWCTIAALSLLISPTADACTTFCLLSEGRVVLGKNYDWYVAPGMLFLNKRGMERASYPINDRGARWLSKYGSVTFNQYGRDAPSGGLNEVGLVVEILWMNGTTYPAPDHRPALDGTGWAQYQLDMARTVDDVLASDSDVRIGRAAALLHFLVADRSGQVAVIEFRDGKRVVHQGVSLPALALANDFYSEALTRSADLEQAGQIGDRFGRAARGVRDYEAAKHGDPVTFAFALLADVAQKTGQGASGAFSGLNPQSITQWSVVYEIDAHRLHFRSPSAAAIKSLSLANIDFSCATQVQVLDLHQSEGGDVKARLQPYSRAANLGLIRASYSQSSFLRSLPEQELERVAARPEQGACAAPVR